MAIRGWTCGTCGEFWEWESEAEQCCTDIEPAWQCSSCHDVFEDELDADACCFFENDCE